ncbi:MAG: IS5 family transposase [bacterium]|nr:IS5 family transposase [bacterium]
MRAKEYPSDLSPREWQIIQPLFPRQKKKGRKIVKSKKSIFNGILYVVKTGCQWNHLPNDFPSYKTVHDYFMKWKRSGLIEKINHTLAKKIRIRADRESTPSAAIVDSQSVKSTRSSRNNGYDGGKKIKGKKRHLMVDVLGLIIAVNVTAANSDDRLGAFENFISSVDRLPRLELIWADGSYTGPLINFTKKVFNWTIDVIKPVTNKGPGFHVRPWYWIVERTFSWLDTNRRLSKNYETLDCTAEALIYVAMTQLMLKRLVSS